MSSSNRLKLFLSSCQCQTQMQGIVSLEACYHCHLAQIHHPFIFLLLGLFYRYNLLQHGQTTSYLLLSVKLQLLYVKHPRHFFVCFHLLSLYFFLIYVCPRLGRGIQDAKYIFLPFFLSFPGMKKDEAISGGYIRTA